MLHVASTTLQIEAQNHLLVQLENEITALNHLIFLAMEEEQNRF